MHESIGGFEPCLDAGAVGLHLAIGSKRPRRGRQPRLACSLARLRHEVIEHRGHANTVLPRPWTEHARGAMKVGILVTFKVTLRQRLRSRLEQLPKAREDIAKQ